MEENGKQYITGIHNHTLIGYKYFDLQDETFITLMTRGTGKGIFRVCADPSKTLVRIEVTPSGEWKESSEKLRIEGTHTIYLIYEGSGMTELLSIDFSVPSVRK